MISYLFRLPALPVHVILGVNEYTIIKTQDRQRVGLPGEPIAELKN